MSVGGDPWLFATVFHKQLRLWHALGRYLLIPIGRGSSFCAYKNGFQAKCRYIFTFCIVLVVNPCGQIGVLGTKFKIKLHVMLRSVRYGVLSVTRGNRGRTLSDSVLLAKWFLIPTLTPAHDQFFSLINQWHTGEFGVKFRTFKSTGG